MRTADADTGAAEGRAPVRVDGDLHYIQVLGDFSEGGDGRLAIGLARALSHRGVRSTCVSTKHGGARDVPEGEVDAVDLGANRGPAAFVRALRKLRSLVHGAPRGIVHAHGPKSLVFAVAALVLLRRRHRIWFTWHDSGTVLGGGFAQRRATAWAIARCDRVFASSSSVRRRLQEALRDRVRVEVFTNGVADCPPTTALDAECPTLLWTARFVPPKDPKIVIRSVGRLASEGHSFRAVMAGDAPSHLEWFLDEVRDAVDEHGIGDRIEFPGWVSDTAELRSRCAIGVQSSHTEGLSIATLEQMMSGMAVVATDVGDTTVAVRDGETGLVIPPRDEEALTAALRRLVREPELRRRLGDRARAVAKAEFSFDVMARRVLMLARDDEPRAARGTA